MHAYESTGQNVGFHRSRRHGPEQWPHTAPLAKWNCIIPESLAALPWNSSVALKTAHGGRHRRRHGRLDFLLSNSKLADVEQQEQACASGILLFDFRGDSGGQSRWRLVGSRDPIFDWIVFDVGLAIALSLAA